MVLLEFKVRYAGQGRYRVVTDIPVDFHREGGRSRVLGITPAPLQVAYPTFIVIASGCIGRRKLTTSKCGREGQSASRGQAVINRIGVHFLAGTFHIHV